MMSHQFTTLFMTAALCAASSVAAATGVEVKTLKRADGLSLPAAIYSVAQCQGIAVISHGAGGSESGYSYLAKALQEHAWFTVVPGHQESGIPALRQHMRGKGVKDGLATLITDAKAYEGRFLDITAALEYAKQQCNSDTYILLGHSMGAATTMMLAGAQNGLGVQAPALGFHAYIAMSPQGVGSIFPQHAWSAITAPVLSMTGTRDTELGGLSWQTRLDPFKDMRAPCKWSAIIDGATHMSFGGMTRSAEEKNAIIDTTLHFMRQVKQRQCTAPVSTALLQIEFK